MLTRDIIRFQKILILEIPEVMGRRSKHIPSNRMTAFNVCVGENFINQLMLTTTGRHN
jgi:hypothetical protein